MASPQRQSWFARHCAPLPPANDASACPCSSCFNRSPSFSSTTSTASYSSSSSPPSTSTPDYTSQTISWPSWSRRKSSSRRVYQSIAAGAGPGPGDSTTALLPTPDSDVQSVRSYNMTAGTATDGA